MIIFILIGLIIEQLHFAGAMAIGEICVWFGVITMVVALLIWTSTIFLFTRN